MSLITSACLSTIHSVAEDVYDTPLNTERKQSLREKPEEEAVEKKTAQNQAKVYVQANP